MMGWWTTQGGRGGGRVWVGMGGGGGGGGVLSLEFRRADQEVWNGTSSQVDHR